MKKFIIGVLLVAPLFLTGCSKQPPSDKYKVVNKIPYEKVCIDGFVYLQTYYTLTPKIKNQTPNGVVFERCDYDK